MPRRFLSLGAGFCVLLAAVRGASTQDPAPAGAASVEHQAVDCILAGKYARIPACFEPQADVAGGRVYFQLVGKAAWYHVEMKPELNPDKSCWIGNLPKASTDLVGQRIYYYVQATWQDTTAARSSASTALVVRSKEECKEPLVAMTDGKGPAAVVPLMP